jgi:hypothetical protein
MTTNQLNLDLHSRDQIEVVASSDRISLFVAEVGASGSQRATLTPKEAVALGNGLRRLGEDILKG